MRTQCVLVATTLLHSGAKFHSFPYTGSKTVTPAEIHHRLQAAYGENTVNRTTVNRWAIKFRECESGRANIVDQPRSGRPVSVTDEKHQKQVDELIKHYCHIIQKQIAGRLGMSKERVGYIVGLLGYTKVCGQWVPRKTAHCSRND